MNLANKITMARVVLIPVFLFFIMTDLWPGISKWIALGVFISASLTDFVDGYIARKYEMVTNLGKFMDPLADKMLVCSALICLLKLDRINVWLVLIVIGREFIISGFRLAAVEKGVVIAASWWGKAKTVSQMIMIGLMIGNLQCLSIITTLSAWVVLVLTLISLFDYLYKNRIVISESKETKDN